MSFFHTQSGFAPRIQNPYYPPPPAMMSPPRNAMATTGRNLLETENREIKQLLVHKQTATTVFARPPLLCSWLGLIFSTLVVFFPAGEIPPLPQGKASGGVSFPQSARAVAGSRGPLRAG